MGARGRGASTPTCLGSCASRTAGAGGSTVSSGELLLSRESSSISAHEHPKVRSTTGSLWGRLPVLPGPQISPQSEAALTCRPGRCVPCRDTEHFSPRESARPSPGAHGRSSVVHCHPRAASSFQLCHTPRAGCTLIESAPWWNPGESSWSAGPSPGSPGRTTGLAPLAPSLTHRRKPVVFLPRPQQVGQCPAVPLHAAAA